jgi:hypothetical protein
MTTLLKIMEINVIKGSSSNAMDVPELETVESSKPVKVAKLVGATLAIGAATTGLILLAKILRSVFRSVFSSDKNDLVS